ncbi:MAG: hybrid sensor histidine kinase/response regulator [Chloroflexota bacterium]|nr:MAG: hybrid sensor histidine kinase/response regulator [Chloroflexota bacterium]
MSLSKNIREQLLNSFRAELTEHVQTMTDGLLAIEQHQVSGDECKTTLETIFRAAHSLKGAARAMGVTTIEQLAHALEEALDGLRRETVEPVPSLFTACYHALDAVQQTQAVYESGETTPPLQALQALVELQALRLPEKAKPQPEPSKDAEPAEPVKKTAQANVPPEPEPVKEPEPSGGSSTGSSEITTKGNLDRIPTGDETIRVSVGKLDNLMAQLSELLVTRIRAGQRLEQIHQLQNQVSQMQKEWLVARAAHSHLVRKHNQPGNGFEKDVLQVLDYTGASQDYLRSMISLVNDLAREFNNDNMHMALVIDDLEEEIKRVRMLPLSTITGPFARMVRDLAHEAGKEVILEIQGADTELDKHVLEQIKDPLVHLLRNAVDHGIEPPDQRTAAGKPRGGVVTLSAEQLGKDVVISVADDGAGLNIDAIRKALMRHRGGLDQGLSDSEVAEAIFQAGVSTRMTATNISGRGVGLDVVRRNVEELNGRINLSWKPDYGTVFRLTLPLGLTSSRGLLVHVSGQLFAIPLSAVEHILLVDRSKIASLEGRDTVKYEGRPITLVSLGDLLDLPRATGAQAAERIPVVVLGVAERRMAFAVDELSGEQEMVIKGLGKQLQRVGGIAGATVMGDGQVVLILNVADLIKLALHGDRRKIIEEIEELETPEAEISQGVILVVDDSITTRTLEKNILEAAGYLVKVAVDGQEALGVIASEGMPCLIISDIMMPRMDGFELTRRIKSDPRLSKIPVILVSSLDSTEDKAKGIEAGADAYIVKGQFDQGNLLDTIRQLV